MGTALCAKPWQFSREFRRQFGVSPSQARTALTADNDLRVKKNTAEAQEGPVRSL